MGHNKADYSHWCRRFVLYTFCILYCVLIDFVVFNKVVSDWRQNAIFRLLTEPAIIDKSEVLEVTVDVEGPELYCTEVNP